MNAGARLPVRHHSRLATAAVVESGWRLASGEPVTRERLDLSIAPALDADTARRAIDYAQGFGEVHCVLGNRRGGPYDLRWLAAVPRLRTFLLMDEKFDAFDQLAALPPTLEALTVDGTRAKGWSLRALERWPALRELKLEGHSRDIEAVASLRVLERLELKSLTLPGLDFLAAAPRLWWLRVVLGGTHRLEALAKLARLEYLDLTRIRGVVDVEPVSALRNLQNLVLRELAQVRALPDLRGNARLRRLYVWQLKNLTDVHALRAAPALEEYIHTHARTLQPEDFAFLAGHPTLRRLLVGFGSKKKNAALEAWAEAQGLDTGAPPSFEYLPAPA